MSMDVTFLGTGSAYPSPTRGASALVLRREGECWLFDCGEGTQTQFMKSHLKAGWCCWKVWGRGKGKNWFGLEGTFKLIQFQAPCQQQGHLPLDQVAQSLSQPGLQHFQGGAATASLANLGHCLTTLTPKIFFLISNLNLPSFSLGPFPPVLALTALMKISLNNPFEFHFPFTIKRHFNTSYQGSSVLFCLYLPGVQPGPLYGKLKNGTAVVLENGVTISPSDVLENPIPGRKICILGDCSGVVGDVAVKLCSEAEVLIHEATLDDTQEEKAREHGHSTPKMASDFAKLCQVKKLVLTHFSQRYKAAAQRGEGDTDITQLKRQAEAVLDGQEVTLAEDFLTIEIPMKK
ncbi:RNZ1 protein, partial [Nyctiprogne leucopyga]|nr:RNZ1 protein [Nyctiprogne leucopyga]